MIDHRLELLIVIFYQDKNLRTYFAEPYEGERRRRHSIEGEIKIKESELYKAMRPPPLFYGNLLSSDKYIRPYCTLNDEII